jgi:hypothetical protein
LVTRVYKYPSWATEIKNRYAGYPDLHIVFTSRVDLSRRALVYGLPGLSFREFMEIKTGKKIPILELEDIVNTRGSFPLHILPSMLLNLGLETKFPYGYSDVCIGPAR